jgi:hypothetical protein
MIRYIYCVQILSKYIRLILQIFSFCRLPGCWMVSLESAILGQSAIAPYNCRSHLTTASTTDYHVFCPSLLIRNARILLPTGEFLVGEVQTLGREIVRVALKS